VQNTGIEYSEEFGFQFKGKKKLNRFQKALIYFFSATQLFLCITIITLNFSKEYSGISARIMINRLILGFIIVTVINWLIGWSVGNSTYEDKKKKEKFRYSKTDRKIGDLISILTNILFITAVLSFITSLFDIL